MSEVREFKIAMLGGNCPVQAEGVVDGKEFYFRARGQRWSFEVGDDLDADPEWSYSESYGDSPYAAGWMEEDEAREFIEQAVERYRARGAGGTKV
jgi:hypothetical protein